MRAIWTCYVSFDLVGLPVHLCSATEEHGTGFHQAHARDGSRIKHRKQRSAHRLLGRWVTREDAST